MSHRESAREVDDAAALWAARVDAGPLDPAAALELDAWLARDTRRVGAFARARAVLVSMDKARALRGFDGARPIVLVNRRRALVASGAALAACVAGGVWVSGAFGGERFRTRLGEMRVVPLADGSVVTLNTASQIIVAFSDEVREITLVAGEAIFEVADEPSRPFLVRIGDVLVQAASTSFSVRRLVAEAPQILVREGSVQVSERGAAAVRVDANQRVVAASALGQPTHVSAPEIERELAWRDGRLSFEGETLAEAAAEFSRYSETRLVFEDASIADEPITGLFVSTDPVGFAHAVASAFDLEAETRDGEVRLRRPR